jgi:hypothetical protein
MVITQNPAAFNKLCTLTDTTTSTRLEPITPCKVSYVSVNSYIVVKGCCSNGYQCSPFYWRGFTRDNIHQSSHQTTSKRLLVRKTLFFFSFLLLVYVMDVLIRGGEMGGWIDPKHILSKKVQHF